MKTTEIIIKDTAIANPNVNKAMAKVKTTTATSGNILGINFTKLLHKIVLF